MKVVALLHGYLIHEVISEEATVACWIGHDSVQIELLHCIYDEGFVHYVRYVDDAIMLCKSRTVLEEALPRIEAKLAESCQSLNRNKTKIDSVYHGIKFLGRVTYPYGYQRMSKESIGRVIKSANEFVIDQNYLSKLNSQAGRMKHYAAYGVMLDYIKALPRELDDLVYFDRDKWKFVKK